MITFLAHVKKAMIHSWVFLFLLTVCQLVVKASHVRINNNSKICLLQQNCQKKKRKKKSQQNQLKLFFSRFSFCLFLWAGMLVMPVPKRNGVLHATLHTFNTVY